MGPSDARVVVGNRDRNVTSSVYTEPGLSEIEGDREFPRSETCFPRRHPGVCGVLFGGQGQICLRESQTT